MAGVASCDYPHTNIKKGVPMPTHPCFRKVLPLAVALYGKNRSLLATTVHVQWPSFLLPLEYLKVMELVLGFPAFQLILQALRLLLTISMSQSKCQQSWIIFTQPAINIGHQPNAFLKTFLPTQQEGMS